MKVNEVKTPQEVAQMIIKNPEDANLIENFEGS
jgi:predicted secreted protein